jgi:hypothetical protein
MRICARRFADGSGDEVFGNRARATDRRQIYPHSQSVFVLQIIFAE